MGNVVTLPGHPLLPAKGEVNHEIVSELKRLLQEAEDGQIVSFAFALYRPIDMTSYGWVHGAFAFHLSSAIMSLQHAFCGLLEEVTIER